MLNTKIASFYPQRSQRISAQILASKRQSGAILAHDEEIVRFSPHLFGENQQFIYWGNTYVKRFFTTFKPLNLGIN